MNIKCNNFDHPYGHVEEIGNGVNPVVTIKVCILFNDLALSSEGVAIQYETITEKYLSCTLYF